MMRKQSKKLDKYLVRKPCTDCGEEYYKQDLIEHDGSERCGNCAIKAFAKACEESMIQKLQTGEL